MNIHTFKVRQSLSILFHGLHENLCAFAPKLSIEGLDILCVISPCFAQNVVLSVGVLLEGGRMSLHGYVCQCSERLKEEARLEEERERKEEIER